MLIKTRSQAVDSGFQALSCRQLLVELGLVGCSCMRIRGGWRILNVDVIAVMNHALVFETRINNLSWTAAYFSRVGEP